MKFNMWTSRVAPVSATLPSLVALAALMAGCASTEPQQWRLNGRSLAEFRAHDQACADRAAAGIDSQNLDAAGEMMGSGLGAGSKSLAGVGLLIAALELGSVSSRRSDCMRALGYSPAT